MSSPIRLVRKNCGGCGAELEIQVSDDRNELDCFGSGTLDYSCYIASATHPHRLKMTRKPYTCVYCKKCDTRNWLDGFKPVDGSLVTDMFAEQSADLPLFSGTTIKVVISEYKPRQIEVQYKLPELPQGEKGC